MTLESKIQSVSVFNLGAEVTRQALLPTEGLKLPARIALDGLPLCLQDSSLTAFVESGAKVVEAAVELQLTGPETDREKEREALNESLDQVKLRRERLQWWLGAFQSLSVCPRAPGKEGEPPAPLPVQSRLQWLRFVSDQLHSSQKTAWQLDDEIGELERAIEQLERPENEECIIYKRAVLTLEGPGELPAGTNLKLAYRVPGVRWAPSYLLRFNSELTRAQVSMLVSIAQKTGEDWSDVQLSVSSADGEACHELPELKSLRIGRSQPPAAGPSWKAPPLDTLSLFQDYDRKLIELGSMPPSPYQPVHFPVGFATTEPVETGSLQPRRDEPVAVRAPGAAMGGAMMSGALAAALPAPAPEPQKKRKGALLRMRDEEGGGGNRAFADKLESLPPNEPTLTPDPTLRDYARLVMPGSQHQQRGRLLYQTLEDQVAEAARAAGLDEDRFCQAARAAVRKAESVGYSALPQGFVHPRWPGEDEFDLYYSGQSPCSVSSDGAFHSVALQLFSLDVKPRYVAVPRETPQFFRHVTGTVETALADGPADIYIEDSFLLTGPIKGAAPGGSFGLALGVEDRLKIVRNTAFKESVSGLVNKTRQMEHTINLEIVSNFTHEVIAEVRERLPQGRDTDKEVEVAVTASDPTWESFEPPLQPDFRGAKRWVFPLPPNGKKLLSAGYTISIPAKYDLENGNRRES